VKRGVWRGVDDPALVPFILWFILLSGGLGGLANPIGPRFRVFALAIAASGQKEEKSFEITQKIRVMHTNPTSLVRNRFMRTGKQVNYPRIGITTGKTVTLLQHRQQKIITHTIILL